MKHPPWDQRAARYLVRPLARTSITPNQVTIATLLIAVGGAALMAAGRPALLNWGASIFVVARFLDHCDGELARQTNQTSRLGYYLDYFAGMVSYAALFLCIGFGLRNGPLGEWSVAIGGIASAVAIGAFFVNLRIDHAQGGDTTGEAVGYPGFAGFELEDGIYLIAPITWLGWVDWFFAAAGAGAVAHMAWTFFTLVKARRR
ncbi:MAG: CDP-alcohol phosphatidyltransferase family protein [Proteobacteria bacterium]|nr:CDP-alcohol phosphatidyltransferase family protein [Pseudomonadota bacterium]